MTNKFKEKRTYPRINLRTTLRYQIRGSPEFNNTLSDNVSLGGIGIINNEFIAPKTSLMLEIKLLSRILRPIGKIVWSLPLAHSDRYRLGIEFLELDSKEKYYLQDYIAMKRPQL